MMKRLKAFTLVELLVAMAIIAVLIALAGFGVSLALRASRDSQRQEAVDNIRVGIADYLGRENVYPTGLTYNSVTGKLSLDPAPSGNPIEIPLSGVAKVATATDSKGTQYCYNNNLSGSDGYILGAKLENGNWYELGTSTTHTCEANGASSYLTP